MTDNRENMLDKVRALLSKTRANGCTEAEELAALAKARAMIDAYEISDQELALTKEEKAVFFKEPPGSRDPHRIKADLAVSVAKFTATKCWRGHGGLIFCGLRPDCEFATWLLDHLANFVKAEMVTYLASDVSIGHARRSASASFAAGCTSRIARRLQELCASSAPVTSNAGALVVVKDQAIREKMEAEGIRLRSSHSSRTIRDGTAYGAGKSAGDRASFGRPVSGNGAVLRLRGSS